MNSHLQIFSLIFFVADGQFIVNTIVINLVVIKTSMRQ